MNARATVRPLNPKYVAFANVVGTHISVDSFYKSHLNTVPLLGKL